MTEIILKKQENGWELVDGSENVLDSGDYPLVEDKEFIESIANLVNNWSFINKPYEVVDERIVEE